MKKRPSLTLIPPDGTTVIGSIKFERIPGDPRFVRLLEDFWFYSTLLKRWCCIPEGFVCDEESVPLLKGTNPEAGTIHDYLCRTDSDPVVSKVTAAQVYLEFQTYYDKLEVERARWKWLAELKRIVNESCDVARRRLKRNVVVVYGGYFHLHKVGATYEEVAGLTTTEGGRHALD